MCLPGNCNTALSIYYVQCMTSILHSLLPHPHPLSVSFSIFLPPFPHSYLLEQNCTNGEIRLIGGSGPHEGRVEVCSGDQWSTVCDNGWDETDAGVVCRQLGYEARGQCLS